MSEAPQGTCRICHETFSPHPMGSKNDWKFIACRSCGSVMVDPWPTAAEIEQFFADVQPEIVHVPNPDMEIAANKKTIQKVMKDPSGKRFVDICARQGYATEAAWQLGMHAQGIDSHEFFYKFAKEKYPTHKYSHAQAEDFAKTGAQADLVFALEAFCEHPDPDALAEALAGIVAPDGKIYIEEADGNSFNVPKVFTNWNFVDPPINFLYISKKGMEKLLARHGLKIEKSFFNWAPFMRLIVTKK